MSQPNQEQEQTAWRFQSSRFDTGYECELPPDQRKELGAVAKRPRILGPPQPTTPRPAI